MRSSIKLHPQKALPSRRELSHQRSAIRASWTPQEREQRAKQAEVRLHMLWEILTGSNAQQAASEHRSLPVTLTR